MTQEWDVGVASYRRRQHKGIISAERFHDDDAGVHAHSNEDQGEDMESCGNSEYVAQITLCAAHRVGVLRRHAGGRTKVL